MRCSQYDKRFQKKLAHDTESANVLVAAFDFLDAPVVVAGVEQPTPTLCAFVRLAGPLCLSRFTEVSVPTRFVCVLCGPRREQPRLRQVGRAMATVFNDEVRIRSDPTVRGVFDMFTVHMYSVELLFATQTQIFHEIAYKARSKEDILNGVGEFLNNVTGESQCSCTQ